MKSLIGTLIAIAAMAVGIATAIVTIHFTVVQPLQQRLLAYQVEERVAALEADAPLIQQHERVLVGVAQMLQKQEQQLTDLNQRVKALEPAPEIE